MANPFKFLQETRTEVAKVTWPSRRETVITALMVFVMALFAALFFFSIDQLLGLVIGLVLG